MKKLIIIGGGFSGAYLAKELQDKFDLTLIDSKEYFEFTPSVLKALIRPKLIPKIQVQHQNYLKKARLIFEPVQKITSENVHTKEHTFPFDYLVISSGSSYHPPIKSKEVILINRDQTLQEYSTQLHSAKQILIIGGGLVGIELAAEIATNFQDKYVVLCHSQSCLLERCLPKIQGYVLSFLRKNSVKVILNEKVIKKEKNVFLTNQNREIPADLVFWCIGISPNSEFLSNFNLDQKKFLKVNTFLQVNPHPNIFAAGDITAIPEEKTAQNAEEQAKIVMKNILNLEQNKPLIKYRSSSRMMLISLGKFNGILTYKHFSLTGIIPATLKRLVQLETIQRYK
ncbi:MAG TPA: FAD-dependent oxidoreductase [Candidatus Nanoarchaeia archaeon]|nr:FAD-dependent oxidoreductase [Candidatus Nanoarchaeia archaeon]